MGTQVASARTISSGARMNPERVRTGRVIRVVLLVSIVAIMIASLMLVHHASLSPAVSPAQSDDLMAQQVDSIHTMAAQWYAQATAQIEQQRSLEESTTAADTVPYYRTINDATYYDRFANQRAIAPTDPPTTATQALSPATCTAIGTGVYVVDESPEPRFASSCP